MGRTNKKRIERRPAAKAKAKKAVPDYADKQGFHSVTIVTGSNPCVSAQVTRGHRFLARRAPFLPLISCSNFETCDCIYLHYDDRRHSDRRQDFFQSGAILEDHRHGHERRRDGNWRQTNAEPSAQDVRNSLRRLRSIVECLLTEGVAESLDDLYVSLDQLREEVEFRVLLDSVDLPVSNGK